MSPTDFVRRWGWHTMAAATSFVIAFSALRGIARGYEPVGDNALIELRARDVLTGDHPFLGTWSSASISAGIDVNHPGPLIFDLVALPVRLFGGAAGIAVGVALLQITMVWLVGYVTFRAGGMTAAITALTVTAGIVWTLGSELLYDPWQPNVLVLPFWVLLCTVWAIVAGQVGLFPLACGVGSFAMQTHMGYIIIVPVLLAFAAAMVVRSHRGGQIGELRRPTVLSVAVIGIMWAQPLWEQFFGPGRGNLGRVVTAGSGGGEDFEAVESTATGVSLGIRMLGSVLALPPWWGRPGYDDSIPGSSQTVTADGLVIDAPGLRTLLPASLGLLLMVTLLVIAWRVARRAGADHVIAGFATLTAALTVATITIVITPIDILGLSPHKVRWLWVIGAFATFVLAMAALTGLSTMRRHQTVASFGVIATIALIATLPGHANRSGPVYFEATYESVANIRSQIADYLDDNELGPVLFDAEGIGFAEPYTAPAMAELLENGVDLVVDDRSLSRQLGPERRADPSDPTSGGNRSVIFVRAGAVATSPIDGAERIAFHDGDTSPYSVNDITDRAVAVFLLPPGSGAIVEGLDL